MALWTHTDHPELIHPEIDVAQIKIVVPSSFAATEEDCALIRRDWCRVYDSRRGDLMAITIDITDDSTTMYNAMILAPTILDVLRSTRKRAEEQMLATGFITGNAGRALISLVLGLGYGPASTVVYASTVEELAPKLHAAALNRLVELKGLNIHHH